MDWRTKKILDHGFVHLVDAMPHWNYVGARPRLLPADARVVQAARVSMGHLPPDMLEELGLEREDEERTDEQDVKLINYLMKNRHTTPFEKVRFEFAMKLPIFVARQWIRHRMGCLAGDVELHFERPDSGRAYPKKIEDVFRSFQDPRQRARAKEMRLRCIDEASLALGTTTISSIWESGIQDVYLVVTHKERTLRLTDSHQVLTEHGWELFGAVRQRFENGGSAQLRGVQLVGGPGVEQKPPESPDNIWLPIPGWEGRYEASDQGRIRSLVNTRGRRLAEPVIKKPTIANNGYPSVSLSKFGTSRLYTVHSLVSLTFNGPTPVGMEIRHNNGNRQDPGCENLSFGTSTQNSEDMFDHDSVCRLEVRPEEIIAIEFDGTEMTYDLEVEGPHHNFVANGLIVHNSFNEMSARYTTLPCEFYVPVPERMQAQSDSNKQASGTVLDAPERLVCEHYITAHSKTSYVVYEKLLSHGLARELARMVLPTNFYTQWYWTVDLHNLLGFLKLRLHEHAQFEIRAYAEAIVEMVERVAPVSVAAWRKHVVQG